MKLFKNTLILMASVVLCTSCSNYYSRHSKNMKPERMQRNAREYDPSAKTHGARLAKNVDEFDRAVIEEDESSKGANIAQHGDDHYLQWARASNINKCIPAKPIGGTEQHCFFDFNKSVIASNDMSAVKNQALYLIKHPGAKVRIEGNADDRGSREYNIALSARRAKAIIEAFKREGVQSKQFSLVSYGAEKPAAKGENKDAYHCNRRVDIIYEVR